MSQMTFPAPTDRIRFRRYKLSDLGEVVEMFADDEAKRWYPTHSQPDEAQRWIDWNIQSYEEHGVGLWVVENCSTGAFLGDCGLTYQTVEGERLLEIGYHLQSKHRGRGYALQSARQCVDFAFRVLGALIVCSIVDPRNNSSIQVAAAVHDSMRTFTNQRGHVRNLYWTDNDLKNGGPLAHVGIGDFSPKLRRSATRDVAQLLEIGSAASDPPSRRQVED